MTNATPPRDGFYWLGEINKASTIVNVERGIVRPELGRNIAATIAAVLAAGSEPGAARSSDYVTVERDLLAHGGPEISRLHSGRSRMDVNETQRRLAQRDVTLDAFSAFLAMRATLLDLATRYPDAIVPIYTVGRHAAPSTFGHYLLGYLDAFTRVADRYRESYRRLNLCPLGATVGAGTSFALDRGMLADLLGFDGVVENTIDAVSFMQLDLNLELASIGVAAASTIGMMMQDFAAQYTQADPWVTLVEAPRQGADGFVAMEDGKLITISSAMPHKRNPAGITKVRTLASQVVGEAVSYLIQGHNVMHGVTDYKVTSMQSSNLPAKLFDLLAQVLAIVQLDTQRARAEVDKDYSTTIELADVLQRRADVAFRVGHHFASLLVDFGRERGLKSSEISYVDACSLFTTAASDYGMADARFPLDEADYRMALDPVHMVQSSAVLGGPQRSEVDRMLARQRQRLADDGAWLAERRNRLDAAAQRLQTRFARLTDRL